MIKDENLLVEIIQSDKWMMEILKTTEKLELPDCWVCAGFIRNKVWDWAHHYPKRTTLNDVDVIYFDPCNFSEKEEKRLENQLHKLMTNVPWSVKNQARMHIKNKAAPYISSNDAIAHFPEIPTAIGARLINQKIEIIAPYGTKDLFSLRVEPTPYFTKDKELHKVYTHRVNSKNWKTIWPNLIFV